MTSFEMTRAAVFGVRKELRWLKVRIARAGPAQTFNIFRRREVAARPPDSSSVHYSEQQNLRSRTLL